MRREFKTQDRMIPGDTCGGRLSQIAIVYETKSSATRAGFLGMSGAARTGRSRLGYNIP